MKCKLLSVLTLAFQLWTIGVMAGDRPNILFLFADDQRADTIAALGNSHIQTPNLDRLVRRGLAFDRAYMQGGLNGEMTIRDEALLRWPRQPEKIREMIAEYYRYVSYLDAEIGRV
ncbi:MAG: sulfatase-like hydrolase/transferase, partial [Planctomycetaceae bacterium]